MSSTPASADPAAGVRIERRAPRRAARRGTSPTPTAGSLTSAASSTRGPISLRFDSGSYFAARGIEGFYPEVLVIFTISGAGHVHVPLLLSQFGYSTYRGS